MQPPRPRLGGRGWGVGGFTSTPPPPCQDPRFVDHPARVPKQRTGIRFSKKQAHALGWVQGLALGGQVGAVAWCHAFCPKHGGDTRRYPSCKENSRRATVGGPEWPHFLQCCAGMGHRRQAGGTQLRRGPGKTRFIKRRAARMHRLSEGVRPPLCLRPVRACFIFLKG